MSVVILGVCIPMLLLTVLIPKITIVSILGQLPAVALHYWFSSVSKPISVYLSFLCIPCRTRASLIRYLVKTEWRHQ